MLESICHEEVKLEAKSKTEAWLAEHVGGRRASQTGESTRPLELLDLPLDILQAILREVTHTNDLTALALTHSSLHNLVIPHIYSRFDIVWPEANPTVESRVGVDALTYGLATLVMAHDVFGERPYQQARGYPTDKRVGNIRRGNWFAQHTKKFSLGNGPPDWVTEYLITKEGGKMLGTLVALAVGRMRNLEAFIWDMPTGVLRDVWLALASLDKRNDDQECRLEKVWVRWHDNRDAAPLPSPQPPATAMMPHPNLPFLLHGPSSTLFQIPAYPSVMFPTFSILPPLKSISVLDIDEVSYAEELAVLLERSIDRLLELRVGVAAHAQRDLPFRPSEDRAPIPVEFIPAHEQHQARPGGILGILVSQFCAAFSIAPSTLPSMPHSSTEPYVEQVEDVRTLLPGKAANTPNVVDGSAVNELGALLSATTLQDNLHDIDENSNGLNHDVTPSRPNETFTRESSRASTFCQSMKEAHSKKLRLATLELERVYLSIPVLSRAVDWSRLESLTLLGCMNHDPLWKALRKTFTPASVRNRSSSSRSSSMLPRQRASSASFTNTDTSEYKLNVKRIHTDSVSKSLLAFIKDTLAPDTLEWLFLQETTSYKSTVTIDDIYRTAIRRHRLSLRKLLIDSELRMEVLTNRDRDRDRDREDTNWRRWVCHRELISCITSGKMQVRELSISIDYKDWHFFLQRLPNASGLRSLHISHIADHPYGRSMEPREIALQVLDIISLKPELDLCYLGVEKKCFEILEYKGSTSRRSSPAPNGHGVIGITTHTQIEDDEDEDEGVATQQGQHAHVEEVSDEDPDWDGDSQVLSDFDHEDASTDQEDEQSNGRDSQKPSFRLREILFYDDKISIFKARHGKL